MKKFIDIVREDHCTSCRSILFIAQKLFNEPEQNGFFSSITVDYKTLSDFLKNDFFAKCDYSVPPSLINDAEIFFNSKMPLCEIESDSSEEIYSFDIDADLYDALIIIDNISLHVHGDVGLYDLSVLCDGKVNGDDESLDIVYEIKRYFFPVYLIS